MGSIAVWCSTQSQKKPSGSWVRLNICLIKTRKNVFLPLSHLFLNRTIWEKHRRLWRRFFRECKHWKHIYYCTANSSPNEWNLSVSVIRACKESFALESSPNKWSVSVSLIRVCKERFTLEFVESTDGTDGMKGPQRAKTLDYWAPYENLLLHYNRQLNMCFVDYFVVQVHTFYNDLNCTMLVYTGLS